VDEKPARYSSCPIQVWYINCYLNVEWFGGLIYVGIWPSSIANLKELHNRTMRFGAWWLDRNAADGNVASTLMAEEHTLIVTSYKKVLTP